MPECVWDNCERTDLAGRDGFCKSHYRWMHRNRRSELTLGKRSVRPSGPETPTLCSTCEETKPEAEFPLTEKGYVSAVCKTCKWRQQSDWGKQRYSEDPEFRRASRERSYRANYGIGVADYEAMVAAQDGRCLFCREEPVKGGLLVDHAHDTHVIRGLLCWSCNVGFGFIEKMAPDGDFSAILNYLALGKREERVS